MIEVREPATPPAEQSGLTTPTPQPEVGWQSKDSRSVNLYSENVVQEPSSTEVVDRESIANLASTRGKWEAIFTSEPRDEPVPKPKKTTPKWQVRMPYAEKTCAGPDTVSSNNLHSEELESSPPEQQQHNQAAGIDMESAIEREIRLAMEREEMLRREQEERLRQLSQQAQGPQVKGSSSMESSTESELQPSYHELAEADRGAQFFLNHNTAVYHQQQQQDEDAEREEALQKGYNVHQKLSSAGSRTDVGATESIIEREIRLQQEREVELARQRGGHAVVPSAVAVDLPTQSQQQPLSLAGEDEGEVVVVVEEIPYEEAISRYNHDGESRIAQELRELREREEEVRQLRERMHRASVGGGTTDASPQKNVAAPSSSPNKPPSGPATTTTPSHAGSKSMPSTPRGVDKPPTVSVSRSVHNSPRLDATTTPSSKTPPTPKPETPIEREIRLARERENELRRAKGLPELKPEPRKQESVEEKEEVVLGPRHPHYHLSSQPDNTMRRFASNRLQQEILVQRDREMKLRQEGKILSTSEEHIQPQRYTEVVGQDLADGVGGGGGGSVVVKRNFRTPAQQQQQRRNSDASQDSNASGGGDGTPRGQTAPSSTATTPRDGGGGQSGSKGGRKSTAGTGAISFSYREFAQTAESKIERELREMREREEELRKLRSGGAES